eukprot:SAG11_NODE_1620_length_4569_cov_2.059955_2_plen_129_part_00
MAASPLQNGFGFTCNDDCKVLSVTPGGCAAAAELQVHSRIVCVEMEGEKRRITDKEHLLKCREELMQKRQNKITLLVVEPAERDSSFRQPELPPWLDHDPWVLTTPLVHHIYDSRNAVGGRARARVGM